MNLSEKLGKGIGNIVKGVKATPKATSDKTGAFISNFAAGYRSVVPEKTQDEE